MEILQQVVGFVVEKNHRKFNFYCQNVWILNMLSTLPMLKKNKIGSQKHDTFILF